MDPEGSWHELRARPQALALLVARVEPHFRGRAHRIVDLLPTVVRTYATVGQTPLLREELSRDHVSVMSITLEGRLLMIEQGRTFKGEDVVRFLKHALRQLPGKLLVIRNGSLIHRARIVKEFLAEDAATRVQLERLPG